LEIKREEKEDEMKVKIFEDDHFFRLEECINRWLDDHQNIRIQHIAQSTNDDRYTWISIWYTEEQSS